MSSSGSTSSSSVSTGTEPEWKLARRGIHLLLNNQMAEAEKLFATNGDNIHMAAGHCFILFMNAMMTFDNDKMEACMQGLKLMEKRCAHDVGWLKAVRNRMFGQDSQDDGDLCSRLERQIILADTQVCLALLTFLQQDLGSYVKGGWVLRRAWKVYQQTYSQLRQVYAKVMPQSDDMPSFPSQHGIVLNANTPCLNSPNSDWSIPSSPTPPTTPNGFRNGFTLALPNPLSLFIGSSSTLEPTLTPNDARRLLCAVSFGYGVFQLCASLLPPSILRLIHLLGFQGDRENAIKDLLWATKGEDMRAPLASLALLWYHTIVRPFFALDGCNVQAGAEAADLLITESKVEFGSSALFLFFKGRVERLKSNVGGALVAYEAALRASTQPEVKLLCLHEIGWCYLLQLSWKLAHQAFLQLRKHSKWSQSFYSYLTAVCVGAVGSSGHSIRLCGEVSKLAMHRTSQLESFLLRRALSLGQGGAARHHCLLYGFEMLYLWHALPSCAPHTLNTIREECVSMTVDRDLDPLRCLLLGAVLSSTNQTELAIESFRSCVNASKKNDERNTMSNNEGIDSHVTPFAMYELSALLCKDPQTHDEGRAILQEVRDEYKGYDFESRLNVRVHAALRDLE